MNMLSLVHSALDLSPRLYNFAQWLNSSEFVNPRKSQSGISPTEKADLPPIQELAALNVSVPLAFANYNSSNGMGCGLQSLDSISKGTIIIKQKTDMGFVSGVGLYDRVQADQKSAEEKDLEDLNKKIEQITRKVSSGLFPANLIQQNRLYQHLILTQRMLITDRIDTSVANQQVREPSAYLEFLKSYMDVLPRDDMTQLIFWPKHILTEIDSQLLIQ